VSIVTRKYLGGRIGTTIKPVKNVEKHITIMEDE